MKNNIFELSDYVFYENDFEEELVYLEGRSTNGKELINIANELIEYWNSWNNEKLTSIDYNFLKKVEKDLFQDWEELTKDEYATEDDYLTDLYNGYLDDDLISFIDERLSNDDILETIKVTGLITGIVGYSNWAYYISLPDFEEDFIEDYYQGYNFYSITQLTENNEVLDVISNCYLPENENLENMINDYFTFDGEINLVDNEQSQYFDFPKVEEVVNITYVEKDLIK